MQKNINNVFNFELDKMAKSPVFRKNLDNFRCFLIKKSKEGTVPISVYKKTYNFKYYFGIIVTFCCTL